MNDKIFQVEEAILVFAMRYAINRQTFAPTMVVDNILHNIALVDSFTIDNIIREIDDQARIGWNMDCDRQTWLGFKTRLERVLVQRSEIGEDK